MKKFVKKQVKPRKLREPRSVIVSFRLRKSEAKTLSEEMKRRPMVGVKSMKQYARKLTLDHALGRTVYVDPRDIDTNPETRKHLPPRSANVEIGDEKFVKALVHFIGNEGNWNKLRFFMLQFGWPPRLVNRFRAAKTSHERMRVARAALKLMTNENTQTHQRQ